MKRLSAFLILLLMSLTACNIVVQEAPDETAAPEKAAVFNFSEEWQERQALISVSLGEEAADLVVVNAQLFIPQTGEFITDGWVIAAKGRRIAYLGPAAELGKSSGLPMIETLSGPDTMVVDAEGQTGVPGFGHSHNHIESSRLTPTQYPKAVLPHGTTWVVEGDHETGNVGGIEGVTFWIDMQPDTLKVFPAVTSAVPPSDEFMEPTGGWFGYDEVGELLDYDWKVKSIGEVMFEPGIQDPNSLAYGRLQQVLMKAWEDDVPVQGHTGGNGYSNIATFRDVGILSNHNPRTDDHVGKVGRLGLMTDLASNRANFPETVIKIYQGGPYAAEMITLSTDDRDLPETIKDGDIDHNIREYIKFAWAAIDEGVIDVTKERVLIDALRASGYTAAQMLRLENEVGSFSPGAFADIVLLDGQSIEEIAQVNIDKVIASGVLVVADGELLPAAQSVQEPPAYSLNTVFLNREIVPSDFVVFAPEGKNEVQAWLWRPFDFRPRPDVVTLPVKDGVVQYGKAEGVYKMAAIERHITLSPNPADEIQLGIMFTATSPSRGCSAVATTIQHDAHQLTVHGSCDEAMAQAANRIVEIGGGFVVVSEGEVLAEVSLPVFGMMSNESPEVVLEKMETMREASDTLEWVGTGDRPGHPTDSMTFWFLTPAPWPWNVTTRGIFDLFTGEELPIVW